MLPKTQENGIRSSASDPPKPQKADSFVGSLDALRHKAFRPQSPLAKALFANFFSDPSQMGLASLALLGFKGGRVPPLWGSLEIGNHDSLGLVPILFHPVCSPFVGIPRNWKHHTCQDEQPPYKPPGSPFVGIPRNWKQPPGAPKLHAPVQQPQSGSAVRARRLRAQV